MTFAIVGFCDRTNMSGVAITTSSICVGSRCPWVRAGAGAVTTQNVTDPTIGNAVLDQLDQGVGASEALQQVMANRPYMEYRQVAVVDMKGNTAHFTGSRILGINQIMSGHHCVAAGNLLSSSDVPQVMVRAFTLDGEKHLADRLVTALQAGIDAGGEEGPTHSASLLVAHEQPWPLIDLRVDWTNNCPGEEIRKLWEDYKPQMLDYLARALNPEIAPSYGVAGDE